MGSGLTVIGKGLSVGLVKPVFRVALSSHSEEVKTGCFLPPIRPGDVEARGTAARAGAGESGRPGGVALIPFIIFDTGFASVALIMARRLFLVFVMGGVVEWERGGEKEVQGSEGRDDKGVELISFTSSSFSF